MQNSCGPSASHTHQNPRCCWLRKWLEVPNIVHSCVWPFFLQVLMQNLQVHICRYSFRHNPHFRMPLKRGISGKHAISGSRPSAHAPWRKPMGFKKPMISPSDWDFLPTFTWQNCSVPNAKGLTFGGSHLKTNMINSKDLRF